MTRTILGGALGGLLGAVIWTAVAYAAALEASWMAVGVGALAGLGARLFGAREIARFDKVQRRMVRERTGASGIASGLVAAATALLAMLAGRYAASHALPPTEPPPEASLADFFEEEPLLALLATEIASEYEAQGKSVPWPDGVSPFEAYTEQDFPPEIWNEATARWNALSEEGKAALRARQAEELGIEAPPEEARSGSPLASPFSWLDALFMAIGAGLAFKLGFS